MRGFFDDLLPFFPSSARLPLPSPVLLLIPSDRKAFRDVQMALFDTAISRHSQRLLAIDEIQQLPKLYYYKVAAELTQVIFNGGSTLYTKGVGSVKVMVIESGAVDIVVPPTLHALFAPFKDLLTARDPLNEEDVKVVDPITLATLPSVLLRELGLVLPPDPAASYPLLPEGDNQTKQKKLSITNPQIKAVEAQPQALVQAQAETQAEAKVEAQPLSQAQPQAQPQAQVPSEVPAINLSRPIAIRPLEEIKAVGGPFERRNSPGLSEALDRSHRSTKEPSSLIQMNSEKLTTGVSGKSTDPAVRLSQSQSHATSPAPSLSPAPLLSQSQSRSQSTRSLGVQHQLNLSAKERNAPRGVQPSQSTPIAAPRPIRGASTTFHVETNDNDDDEDEDEDEFEFDSGPPSILPTSSSSSKSVALRPTPKSPRLPAISSPSCVSETSHSTKSSNGDGAPPRRGLFRAASAEGFTGGGGGAMGNKNGQHSGSGKVGGGLSRAASVRVSNTAHPTNEREKGILAATMSAAAAVFEGMNPSNITRTTSTPLSTSQKSAKRRPPAPLTRAASRTSSRNGNNSDDDENKTSTRKKADGYSLFLKLAQSQTGAQVESQANSATNSRASSPLTATRPTPSPASGYNSRPLSPIAREKLEHAMSSLEGTMESNDDDDDAAHPQILLGALQEPSFRTAQTDTETVTVKDDSGDGSASASRSGSQSDTIQVRRRYVTTHTALLLGITVVTHHSFLPLISYHSSTLNHPTLTMSSLSPSRPRPLKGLPSWAAPVDSLRYFASRPSQPSPKPDAKAYRTDRAECCPF